ncbi:MAG TPA: hypothetical protein PK018_19850, partial [Candidatus Competibacter sp.]|nr:hypothetical protein [Candidatus Competibacter sp.]
LRIGSLKPKEDFTYPTVQASGSISDGPPARQPNTKRISVAWNAGFFLFPTADRPGPETITPQTSSRRSDRD